MKLASRARLTVGAAVVAVCSLTIGTHLRAADIEGTSGNDFITGTPDDDWITGYEGNDRITAGRGNDYTEDYWGTNTFRFRMGDVDPYNTDYTWGSGNDTAQFYFPIKGRVFQAWGGFWTLRSEEGDEDPLMPFVVYDLNGGRYFFEGVSTLQEMTPTGPRTIQSQDLPYDPYSD